MDPRTEEVTTWPVATDELAMAVEVWLTETRGLPDCPPSVRPSYQTPSGGPRDAGWRMKVTLDICRAGVSRGERPSWVAAWYRWTASAWTAGLNSTSKGVPSSGSMVSISETWMRSENAWLRSGVASCCRCSCRWRGQSPARETQSSRWAVAASYSVSVALILTSSGRGAGRCGLRTVGARTRRSSFVVRRSRGQRRDCADGCGWS